ncbi:MAG: LytTR family DNA-binding domain-containing protein [Bacteroidota bacterium]
MHPPELLKAVILDDDLSSRELLKQQLSQYCPEVELLREFDCPYAASKFLSGTAVDLLLLDVEMREFNAFEFLAIQKERAYKVILVSGHAGYALEGFRAHVEDYLLKPFGGLTLRSSILRLLGTSHSAATVQAEARLVPAGYLHPQRIMLPTQHGFSMTSVEDIQFLESDNTYTQVYLYTGGSLVVCKALKEFERTLDPRVFIRIHRSYIIHLRFLEEYSNRDGGTVKMANGRVLHIARRKLPLFHEKVRSYCYPPARLGI